MGDVGEVPFQMGTLPGSPQVAWDWEMQLLPPQRMRMGSCATLQKVTSDSFSLQFKSLITDTIFVSLYNVHDH